MRRGEGLQGNLKEGFEKDGEAGDNLSIEP
jgi:hypothetical protein